jgi:hypothetical protein
MEVSGQLHCLATLLLGERAPVIHLVGGWVGPRTNLDILEEREKSLAPAGIPNEPVAQKLCRNAVSYPK